MKTILLALSASSLVLFSASCRTLIPLDPNTGQRSCGMLPEKPCCPGIDCAPHTCQKVEVKPTK